MRHTLANQIEASYVRIIPITWNKNICMRISLLGCGAGENSNMMSITMLNILAHDIKIIQLVI
jgi:hypothetical protein